MFKDTCTIAETEGQKAQEATTPAWAHRDAWVRACLDDGRKVCLQPTLRLSLKKRREINVPKEAREHAEQLRRTAKATLLKQVSNLHVSIAMTSQP